MVNEWLIVKRAQEMGIMSPYIQTHRKRIARLINDLISLNACGRCLDIAGSEAIKALVCSYVNFDHYTLLTNCDVETTAWADKCISLAYDFAIFTEVIEHLKLDPAYTLWQINKILKENGILYLTTVNLSRYYSVYNLAHGLSPYVMGGLFETQLDRHHREYCPYELAVQVAANGFEVIYYTFDCFDAFEKEKTLEWCMNTLKDFDMRIHRDDIAIIAKKIYTPAKKVRMWPIYHHSRSDDPGGLYMHGYDNLIHLVNDDDSDYVTFTY